jgi:hypothetical protein
LESTEKRAIAVKMSVIAIYGWESIGAEPPDQPRINEQIWQPGCPQNTVPFSDKKAQGHSGGMRKVYDDRSCHANVVTEWVLA